MVEKHFNISIAPVRSRGGSLVVNKWINKWDKNDAVLIHPYYKTRSKVCWFKTDAVILFAKIVTVIASVLSQD
jgi:hypothetical protein